jgi:membrane protein required for colicin V production
VAKIVEKIVEKTALTIVNKLLGGIVGTLKFLLILSVLFFVVDIMESTIEIIPKETKDKSLLYRPVAKIAPLIIPGMSKSDLGKDSLGVQDSLWLDSLSLPDSVQMPGILKK